MAAITTGKQRGKPFKPGQSGNPAGRPGGTRNKATLAALQLLEGEASALTRKAIDAALGGDMVALRMCLDRIVAPTKDRPIRIFLAHNNGRKRFTQNYRGTTGSCGYWSNRPE